MSSYKIYKIVNKNGVNPGLPGYYDRATAEEIAEQHNKKYPNDKYTVVEQITHNI